MFFSSFDIFVRDKIFSNVTGKNNKKILAAITPGLSYAQDLMYSLFKSIN